MKHLANNHRWIGDDEFAISSEFIFDGTSARAEEAAAAAGWCGVIPWPPERISSTLKSGLAFWNMFLILSFKSYFLFRLKILSNNYVVKCLRKRWRRFAKQKPIFKKHDRQKTRFSDQTVSQNEIKPKVTWKQIVTRSKCHEGKVLSRPIQLNSQRYALLISFTSLLFSHYYSKVKK